MIKDRIGDQPSFVMPGFRPRVGKQNKHASNRALGQRRDQGACVVGIDPDVAEPFVLDGRQESRHTVDEGFASYHRDVIVHHRLSGKMFTTAEANLEPQIGPRRAREQRQWIIDTRGLGQRDAESRQQGAQQPLSARPQARAMAPAIEHGFGGDAAPVAGARDFLLGGQLLAARKSSIRSVRSQENPPSPSGARPKWP